MSWSRWNGMERDTITLLRTVHIWKLMSYFWNFPSNFSGIVVETKERRDSVKWELDKRRRFIHLHIVSSPCTPQGPMRRRKAWVQGYRQSYEGVDHTGFLPLPKFCIDFSPLRIVVSFHRNRGESSLSLESQELKVFMLLLCFFNWICWK